jgi:prolyl oligopeptidase
MGAALIFSILASPAAAQLANPPVRAVPVPFSETRHGIATADPYRWMEDPAQADRMKTFVRSSSDAAVAQIAKLPRRAEFKATLEAATRAGVRFSDVRSAGDALFFRRLDPTDRIAKLMIRDSAGERLLFDPGAGGVNAAVGSWAISPDGRVAALHVSEAGAEKGAIRFLDVATGRELRPRIEPVWGEFEAVWLSPTRVAFTRMMPGSADPMQGMRAFVADVTGGPETPLLGAGVPQGPDMDPAQFPLIETGEGPWAIGYAANARADQIVFAARRADLAAGRPSWKPLAALDDQVSVATVRGDSAFVLTSKGSSNGRLERRDLISGTTDTIATPAGLILTNLVASADGIWVSAQADGAGRLLFVPDGRGPAREVALPFEADFATFEAAADGRGPLLTLMGWTTAPRSYRGEGGKLVSLDLDSVSWGPAQSFSVTREVAVSADGTKVPMVIVAPAAKGPWPLLLEGYASYGVPTTTPWYNPYLLAWTAQGGAAAYCGTRGGNERGREWHEGGRGINKPKAQADYIACAERVIAMGAARPGGIAATGTSAGGTLAPIAAIKRPDLFGALLPRVAMLNTTRLEAAENGANQYSEMGDPRTADGYRALLAQDSYLALANAKDLPDTLVTIGLNDRRVAPWMGAKFAAAARDRFGSKRLVLIRADPEAGHGIGSTRDIQINEFADVMTLLADRLAANAR